MLSVRRKFSGRTVPAVKAGKAPNPHLWPLVWPVSSIALLLVLAFGSGATAQNAPVQSGPAASAGIVPQFAIADLDGDLRPDLASVDTSPDISGAEAYWIRLQLSAAGPQLIRVAAPSGGLLLEARDVNGDHAVDLVLASAQFKQPVAIFLNNGHGGFSRAEPSAFPGAFEQANKGWRSSADNATRSLGISGQSRESLCPDARELTESAPAAEPTSSADVAHFVRAPLGSDAGRAPPSHLSSL